MSALLIPFNEWNSAGNMAGRTLSFANVPMNLKVFLFGLPEPGAIGSSVFLLSPFLIYLRWVK
jgi:hypothetical protein